jgi:hypothetical protein
MQWSDIPLVPSNRVLRQFAVLWIVFFAGLACWHGFLRNHQALAIAFAVLAFTVGPLGLMKPQAIRWMFVGSMVVTFPIGWVVSRLVLACLFYGIFTPVGLVFRLMGRDALHRRHRPDEPTYWTAKPAAAGPKSYLRQF